MTSPRFSRLRALAGGKEQAGLSVAGGGDTAVIEAVLDALYERMISHAVITGDAAALARRIPDDLRDRVELRNASDAAECAALSVAAIRAGDAGILMKGHVDSPSYLRAVVNRQTGIRESAVLSNVTVAEMPSYPKFLAATDNGIIPVPTLDQKRAMILNTVPLLRGLGREVVKVAALAASEKVSDAIPSTGEAAQLARESREGRFPGAVVDGPFGYDVAVSRAAAQTKALDGSAVAGDADLLLFSTIEAANAVAKAWKFHGQAETGSVVMGARVPVLLNSRSDSADRRINAMLLALAVNAEYALPATKQ